MEMENENGNGITGEPEIPKPENPKPETGTRRPAPLVAGALQLAG